MIYVEGSPMTQ